MSDAVSHPAVADGHAESRPIGAAAAGSRPASTGTLVARPSGRRRWWRDARRRRMLAVADFAAIAVAAAVVGALIGSLWPFAFLPLWLLIAKFFGLYDRDHRALRHLTADEVPVIFGLGGDDDRGARTAAAADLGRRPRHGARSGARRPRRSGWRRLSPARWRADCGGSRRHRSWSESSATATSLESMRRKLDLFRDMHFELAVERRIDELGSGQERTRACSTCRRRRPDRRRVRIVRYRPDLGVEHDLPQAPGQAQRRLSTQGSRLAVAADRAAGRPADPRVQHLGPVTLVAVDQARLRRRRLRHRPAAAGAAAAADRDRDQARQPRTGALLAGARRARRPTVPDVQVPDDEDRRRAAARRRSSASRSSRIRCSSSGTIRV